MAWFVFQNWGLNSGLCATSATTSVPFAVVILEIGAVYCPGQPGPQSSSLHFPHSWNDRYVPLHPAFLAWDGFWQTFCPAGLETWSSLSEPKIYMKCNRIRTVKHPWKQTNFKDSYFLFSKCKTKATLIQTGLKDSYPVNMTE
jgi:hypothetical protein